MAPQRPGRINQLTKHHLRNNRAVAAQQPFAVRPTVMLVLWGWQVFDVYLNNRRNLLVVKKGAAIPAAATSGTWRKSKRRVISVSDEIRSAIQKHGYYVRKPSDLKKIRSGMDVKDAVGLSPSA
jgi:hypothetical protein